MIGRMTQAQVDEAQKLVAEWKPQPSALTIKAMGGIAEAEAYLQKAK